MSSDAAAPVRGLMEHLFRRQWSRLVAALTAVLGPDRLELAEEVVQDAIVRALETWPHRGIPDDPAAWLARAARNRAIDLLRRESNLQGKLAAWDPVAAHASRAGQMDDELAMIFLCCHPALSRSARVALTLKSVGGFGVTEIARAFLAEPDTVAQRLVRAKRTLRESGAELSLPEPAALRERLESVHDVLYLMFNEGYQAAAGDTLVRAELCAEAIRLGELIAANPVTMSGEIDALLALMYLQGSRLPARMAADGAPLLLDEQDRARWDRAMIAHGMRLLDRSARDDRVTRFHLEAGIAACHAVAARFEETDWMRIEDLYMQLQALNDSSVVALNRAVAIGMTRGIACALGFLDRYADDPAMQRYVLYHATIGELLRRGGDLEHAAEAFQRALGLPASDPERAFLRRRLAACATHMETP
jgi:RNA polymerase sigma-70 factor (ECF subfamily)